MTSIVVNGTPALSGINPIRGVEAVFRPGEYPSFHYYPVGMIPICNLETTEAIEIETDYLVEFDVDEISAGGVKLNMGSTYTTLATSAGPVSETVTTYSTSPPSLGGQSNTDAVVRNVTITKQ